jgi:hypothetical protein
MAVPTTCSLVIVFQVRFFGPTHASLRSLTAIKDDKDFEEEEDEVETEADRDIEALRKKQEEDAKWMKWAEIQYPDLRKAKPLAAVTTAGKAVVTASTQKLPLPNLKKPASSLKPE